MFSRLGGKTTIKRPAESTSFDPEDYIDSAIPLEYAGVLKTTPTKKQKLMLPKVTIMNDRATAGLVKTTVADRLGPANISVSGHDCLDNRLIQMTYNFTFSTPLIFVLLH